MSTTPTNRDDAIDSRDIIARIEVLESVLPTYSGEIMPGTSEELQKIRDELAVLKTLVEEADGSPDWEYGEILIRDSYFRDYAQEFAEDCCEMPDPDKWPGMCIDWDQAAKELQMDYMSVDFDGVDYWIRA